MTEVGAGLEMQDGKLLRLVPCSGVGLAKAGSRMGFVSTKVGTSFGIGMQDEELLWVRTGSGSLARMEMCVWAAE